MRVDTGGPAGSGRQEATTRGVSTHARRHPNGRPPSPGGGSPLLEVRGLQVAYGDLQVLFDVDLHVRDGERVGLLGTNGAGKSTVLRAIAGLLEPLAGTVTFDGRDVTRLAAEERVPLGMALVEGGRAVFPSLTVRENLRLGAYRFLNASDLVATRTERALDLLPELRPRLDQQAGTLSGGEQQMLALARAFVTGPRLLLVDELSLGLAPVVLQVIADALERMVADGTTVLVVEQSLNLALRLTDRAYFMEKGEVRFAGRTAELVDRGDLVRSVFFGGRPAS